MNTKKASADQFLVETHVEFEVLPNESKSDKDWHQILPDAFAQMRFNNVPVPKFDVQQTQNEIRVTISGEDKNTPIFLFSNLDGCRFLISKERIGFNCMPRKYIGWEKYSALIRTVLEKMVSTDLITGFRRIKLRYINEYDFDIRDKVKIHVDNNSGLNLKTQDLNMVRSDDEIKTFIALSALKERKEKGKKGREENHIRKSSIIDINNFAKLDIAPLSETLQKLNRMHQIEIDSFLGIITTEFKNSLF